VHAGVRQYIQSFLLSKLDYEYTFPSDWKAVYRNAAKKCYRDPLKKLQATFPFTPGWNSNEYW